MGMAVDFEKLGQIFDLVPGLLELDELFPDPILYLCLGCYALIDRLVYSRQARFLPFLVTPLPLLLDLHLLRHRVVVDLRLLFNLLHLPLFLLFQGVLVLLLLDYLLQLLHA